MTSDRARAYGRVIKTIEDLGPAKLQPAEVERLREAADTLLFSEDVSTDTLGGVRELVRHLAESGRWTDERARQLLDDVESCGPLTRV